MLKRISVQHLTLGMYLHEFCGSWMEHPFWRTRFVLDDPKDLTRIRDTDMASEMVKYTASNILQQAGTAMLAQANQSGQGVLQLLR